MLAPAIMVQGTASSVGKSILVTALCRMFRQDGLRVLPFKSQNMALNASVTREGGEIGRAQAVQAEACGVPAHVDMNPILLKPEGDSRSQVIVLGKSIGSMKAAEYHERKPELRGVIAGAIERLRSQCDVMVIEGAGSPAEVNLRPKDIVNMHVAEAANAAVLLAGDIDRGGVFAALIGTLELLEPHERARVRGLVINRFRGDLELLRPGLDFLTERTGIPTLGVVPHIPALRIADEDSVSLDRRKRRPRAADDQVEIAVVRLPRISNYDDFEPLEAEPGLVVRFALHPHELEGADLVIVPGSKSTVSDLAWLRSTGMAEALAHRASLGDLVLGICGGCQLLGEEIADPHGIESDVALASGLGLLPVRTCFTRTKQTAQVTARTVSRSFLAARDTEVHGYEIHSGRVERTSSESAPFATKPGARQSDGAITAFGNVVGTMLHGLFESDAVRAHLITTLRRRRGLGAPPLAVTPGWTRDQEYDRLAAVVRSSLDGPLLRSLLRG